MTDAVRFTGGRVWTGRRYVEAILLEGGRVAAAGTEREVRQARPIGAEDRRLSGQLVVPGLVDAHLHLTDITRTREGLDLRGVESVDRLIECLAQWAVGHPSGALVGRGWDQERMAGVVPTRRDLERVARDRPIVVYHVSSHMAVLNGSALEAAGFDDQSHPPRGGRLGRGAEGELDGRVYERALEPVGALVHRVEPVDAPSVGRTLTALTSVGLTTVCTLGTSPGEWRILKDLHERTELQVRVLAYARASLLDRFGPAELRPGRATDTLAMVGVKAYADGAFGPRTAWLSEPYADDARESGESTLAGPELDSAVASTIEAGLVPAVHALGDRAVAEVVRSFESCGRTPAAPSRIEHVGLVPPGLHDSLAQVRPTLVVQPGFVWSDSWLGDRLGPERVRWAYPFRTLKDLGLIQLGSSDAPFDPFDPWRGLAAAVHREDPGGRSANPAPAEALAPEEAFALYTGNVGPGLGATELGSLEAGSVGDLGVLSAPDIAAAVSRGAACVEETWSGGRRVYARGTTPRGATV